MGGRVGQCGVLNPTEPRAVWIAWAGLDKVVLLQTEGATRDSSSPPGEGVSLWSRALGTN